VPEIKSDSLQLWREMPVFFRGKGRKKAVLERISDILE
jgi:hypothetical protein